MASIRRRAPYPRVSLIVYQGRFKMDHSEAVDLSDRATNLLQSNRCCILVARHTEERYRPRSCSAEVVVASSFHDIWNDRMPPINPTEDLASNRLLLDLMPTA
jgi:hypothetical protein